MTILEACKLSKEVSLMDNLFQQIDFVYFVYLEERMHTEKELFMNSIHRLMFYNMIYNICIYVFACLCVYAHMYI